MVFLLSRQRHPWVPRSSVVPPGMVNTSSVRQASQSPTCVLGETDGQRALCDLLFKQVLLVEEEDDGGVCEPLVVADAVKQLHTLMHAILREGQ